MPVGGRFGPQGLGGPFTHLGPQSHLPHHANPQHHPPDSAGLPPPSFGTHPSFPHGNPASNAFSTFPNVGNSNGLAAGFGGGGGGAGSGGRVGAGGGTGLASSAAMLSFAQAQQHPQPPSQNSIRGRGGPGKGKQASRIRDVWAGNLAQEMQNLREMVEKYPYISMDTEFPGVVARPMGAFTSRADYHYQTLRTNVDLLSVIQLGITLFTPDGETPPPHPEHGPYQHSAQPCPHTWQFNFRFSPAVDMFNQESIDFLASVGLQMDLHEMQGIDPRIFGAMLVTSGLAMFDDVRWISFHSGYDFGYLVKLMHCRPLPEDETEYRRLLALYFPAIFDIKFMVKSAQRAQAVNGTTPLTPSAAGLLQSLGGRSGLQDLADELGIKRVGPAHQAGSDSLLTGRVFWEVKKSIFDGRFDEDKYAGQVWGLNGLVATVPPPLQQQQHQQQQNQAGNGGTGADGHATPAGAGGGMMNGAAPVYHHPGAKMSPSTPNTTHSGLVQTPGQQATPGQTPGHGAGAGRTLTPGLAARGAPGAYHA